MYKTLNDTDYPHHHQKRKKSQYSPVSMAMMGQRCPHGRSGNHKDKILGTDSIWGGVNGGGSMGEGSTRAGIKQIPSCRRALSTNALHFSTAQPTGRCWARTEGQQQHAGPNVYNVTGRNSLELRQSLPWAAEAGA